MLQTAILELGNPRDAHAWERGCRSHGIGNALEPVQSQRPSLQTLLKFFATTPDWIFFSGHFSPIELYDDSGSTRLEFAAGQVALTALDGTQVVMKGRPTFGLDRQCKVTMWGGCGVCRYKETVSTLFNLFGPHVLLGYASMTGAEITEAMLGGSPTGFLQKGNFFDNLSEKENEPSAIRDAWLQAAIVGYRGGSSDAGKIDERMFRAVDPDGQEWYTADGKKYRGRKMF